MWSKDQCSVVGRCSQVRVIAPLQSCASVPSRTIQGIIMPALLMNNEREIGLDMWITGHFPGYTLKGPKPYLLSFEA
eukprot:756052-Hanusia_phi.AAC.1